MDGRRGRPWRGDRIIRPGRGNGTRERDRARLYGDQCVRRQRGPGVRAGRRRQPHGDRLLRNRWPGVGRWLGSQGAVTLAGDGRWQLAVNAGSNDISTFRVRDDGGLVLTDHTDAAGTDPVSLTANGHVVCVLDAGGSGNIAGFRLAGGSLHHLAGSGRPLSGLARNPAEIAFSTDGEFLVATERATTGATTRAAEIKPARYRCAEAPPLLAALGRMAHAAPLRGSSAISTARWLAIVAIAARSLSARGQAATLSGLGAGWLDHRVSGSSGRTPPQPGAPLRHVSVRFGNPGRLV